MMLSKSHHTNAASINTVQWEPSPIQESRLFLASETQNLHDVIKKVTKVPFFPQKIILTRSQTNK